MPKFLACLRCQVCGKTRHEWKFVVDPDAIIEELPVDDASVDDCVNDKLRSEPTPELVAEVCGALSSKLAACSEADPAVVPVPKQITSTSAPSQVGASI